MIDYLSNIIADFYVKENIIQAEEKEVYKCGVELILNDIVTFFLIILISALAFRIKYAVEFLVVFCCTRIYCGGYHAPKAYLCRVIMLITFVCVMLGSIILKAIPDIVLYALMIMAFIVTMPLIPVKHPNKTLTGEYIRKGRRNGSLLYIIFILISVLFSRYIGRQDSIVICLSLCAVTALAIIGSINNGRRCTNEKGVKEDFGLYS